MKRWVLYPKKTDDIIKQLLINRGIKNKESFLNPDYIKDTYDPFLFRGMKKAVDRILVAKNNHEKIGIFADYDADGISGAAILYNFFKAIGINSEVYIPTREEGYGLNDTGIKILHEHGSKLLITVDLGITGLNESKLAAKLGMDIIITDHHEIQKKSFPKNALAVIHPNLPGQKYPNKFLSGGAVAWKLAAAISTKIKNSKFNIENYLKWQLDLAAISIICDIVPLVDENRTLAKFGLIVLSKTKNLGLRKLYEAAAIKHENISSYSVGFQIGPRINAPGRMDHAQASFYLLTTENCEEAEKIARKLNKINKERQDELERVLNEAREKIEKRGLKKKKILLLEDENWPSGIVGLVAGRLMEEFSRPAIVFGEHEGKFKGSGRSIGEFHLLEALKQTQKHLIGFGGHAKAAGLHLEKEHLSFLYDELFEIAESKLKFEDLVPKISIDMEIKPEKITLKLCDDIKKFEPHGLGNPRPVFLAKNLNLSEKRTVGASKNHLKLKFTNDIDKFSEFDAIGFDLGYLYDKLEESKNYDAVFSLDTNIWNGEKKIQLKIMDIKNAQ